MMEPKTKVAYLNVVGPAWWHRFLYKQCRGLVEHGFDVVFFTPVEKPQVVYGVSLIPIQKPQSRIARFFQTFSLIPLIRKGNYDIVVVVNPELLPLAILLKIFFRSKVVFDCHEDWFSFIKQKPYLGPVSKFILSASVVLLFRLAGMVLDGFIFSDKNIQNDFGAKTKKHICFHNYPWLAMWPSEIKAWSDRRYDIVYPGTLSRTGGLFVMLEAIRIVQKKLSHVKCVFAGSIEAGLVAEVEDFLESNNLKNNIEFIGLLPHEQIPSLLNDCKVGLVGLLNLPKFHKNIAGKIFDYMICGVPIVSVDLPPERPYIDPDKNGYLVTPEDPEALAEYIYKILSNEALGCRLSAGSRKVLLEKKYYAETEIPTLVGFLNDILKGDVKCPEK